MLLSAPNFKLHSNIVWKGLFVVATFLILTSGGYIYKVKSPITVAATLESLWTQQSQNRHIVITVTLIIARLMAEKAKSYGNQTRDLALHFERLFWLHISSLSSTLSGRMAQCPLWLPLFTGFIEYPTILCWTSGFVGSKGSWLHGICKNVTKMSLPNAHFLTSAETK